MIEKDIERIYFSRDQIAARVRELGAELSRDYAGKDPILVGILKGSFIFMADLTRCIDAYCVTDFMIVKSRSGMEQMSELQIKKDLSFDIKGRHVLIIEDILDTGMTLAALKNILSAREPASLKICTLLDKEISTDVKADYVGFKCPNEFIVGYGLDYNEEYRNLDYIGVLRPEIYKDSGKK